MEWFFVDLKVAEIDGFNSLDGSWIVTHQCVESWQDDQTEISKISQNLWNTWWWTLLTHFAALNKIIQDVSYSVEGPDIINIFKILLIRWICLFFDSCSKLTEILVLIEEFIEHVPDPLTWKIKIIFFAGGYLQLWLRNRFLRKRARWRSC